MIFKEWLFIVFATTFLMFFYYFIVWWGLSPYLKSSIFDDYLGSGWAFFELAIQGVSFGILFGLINLLVDRSRLSNKSFGLVILVKTALYLIAVCFSQLIVFGIYHVFGVLPIEMMDEMQNQIYPSFLISMFVYFLVVILLINFLLQINRKFGYGILWSMITGRYYKPRKEQRIFMFLDMKDSTANVERLGHVTYSKLIQSCINELSDLIIRYKAQVYQYVGDEIVLTWPTSRGIKDENCLNLFYAFQQRLNDRKENYINKFQAVPVFKAGLSEGLVTVTEVGDIKRELAYHGEALHTAARLEKMCNSLNENILATKQIVSHLPIANGFKKELMGEYRLRGKGKKEEVYGIKRAVVN